MTSTAGGTKPQTRRRSRSTSPPSPGGLRTWNASHRHHRRRTAIERDPLRTSGGGDHDEAGAGPILSRRPLGLHRGDPYDRVPRTPPPGRASHPVPLDLLLVLGHYTDANGTAQVEDHIKRLRDSGLEHRRRPSASWAAYDVTVSLWSRVTAFGIRREYVRHCNNCAMNWTISRRAARARSPGARRRGFRPADTRSAGLKVFSSAYMNMLSTERAAREATADAELEVLGHLRRCPQCGSTDFDEHACGTFQRAAP